MDQASALYDEIQISKEAEYRFLAGIHGIEMKPSSNQPQISKTQSESNSEIPLFGDPDTYVNLSEEEKNTLTEKMMNKHKVWSQQPFGKG